MTDSILTPLVSRLSIATKASAVVKFQPNWAQQIFFSVVEERLKSKIPVRLVILKARQLGMSTATEATIYVLSLAFPNSRGMVIADEVDNANHLLSMTDLFWETDPFKSLYTTKYQAKNTLAWKGINSSIRTATAGNKKAGRSRTIRFLHASEVAFWEEAETVMTGLLQAVPSQPGTMITLESTANGLGNYFEKQWTAAVLGDSEYVPLFFPWWMHPEYRASHIRLQPYELKPYDAEERNLLILFKTGLKMRDIHFTLPESAWDDALAWRRWAIANLCQHDIHKFHQEYPSTPEEAFVATGVNVFPLGHLRQCYAPEPGQSGRLNRQGNRVEFQPDITGPFKMFRLPSPDFDYGIYVIGGDSVNTLRGDYACAQVVNRRTWEQVATWRGRMDPASFAEELAKIGIYYNTALLSPENEGPGFMTIGALVNMDYPNLYQSEQPENLPGRITGKFGFSASMKTKAWAISWLLKLVVDHLIVLHDSQTFHEMRNYVTLEGGGFGAAGGENEHDDTVMALAIACVSNLTSGPLPAYGAAVPGEVEPVWMQWDQQVSVDGL